MAQAAKRSILSPINLPKINRTYKNINRIRQILGVLGRHGFSQLIHTIGLEKLLPFSKKGAEQKEFHRSMSDRLCLAFEELGPTFIKFGQMLASRPDLVTPEFSQSFKRLQDDVQPIPVDQIRNVVETELDGKIETLFSNFEPSALAAASIAQVHRATLSDGKDVVVKVQRPGIEKMIETDLSILYLLAKLAERTLPELSIYDPAGIVDEFSRTIKRATDFIEEGHNIDAFRANLADLSDVVIPQVYWELTSKRVLTMEWIEGIPIRNVERLRNENYDLKKICAVGVDAFFRQVFIDGMFHADLHGGNILVLPGSRIAFVDFGEVGRLGSNALTSIANLFVSLLSKDFYSMAREYLELGNPQKPVDLARFADDLEKFLAPFYGRKIKDVQLGDILSKAAGIAAEHRIRLPRDLVLLGRVIIVVEDSIRQLDPEFDALEHGGRIAGEIVKRKLHPDKLARDLVWNLRDLQELARNLPAQVKYVIQKLSQNELTLQLNLQDFTKGINELDRASNRFAFAIVIAGLVIASSILTYSERGPQYLNMSLLGLIGYLLAGLLGFGLLVSILRSRRL
ncbi:MAG TPA: AarF/ABC1/UbiB kinase family protein [Bdellovibrionota bacterium]|nr:AarF/ABC1/UbiB kinase family protein [Bdellovibrionota bacterium]